MIIKHSDIKRWMGTSFASYVKRDVKNDKIHTVKDLMKCYKLDSRFGTIGGQIMRRRIIKETKEE